MIANLLNLRNVAILAGICAAAFAVQSLRIKVKNNQIAANKAEIVRLHSLIDQAVNANETNQQTISELQSVNQKCALENQANIENAEIEKQNQLKRISDINSKYENLRKIKVVSQCADVIISDDVIRLLQTKDSQRD